MGDKFLHQTVTLGLSKDFSTISLRLIQHRKGMVFVLKMSNIIGIALKMATSNACSTFKQNLNTLLFSQLTSNTKIGYRFYNSSLGEKSNKVNGIALCRGDIEMDILMKDKPIVKAPSQNIPLDPNNFMLVLKPMLYSLTSKASSGDSLRKFSTENETVPRYETIYALTQCTSDISKQECTDCLKRATLILSECYDGVQGARILKSNCSLRYEVYPFYNYIADDSPATSPPSKGIYGSL
nr:cysteine-rich receptor-like protein kinase 25 [Ziziphus jujuba var. spinosa]